MSVDFFYEESLDDFYSTLFNGEVCGSLFNSDTAIYWYFSHDLLLYHSLNPQWKESDIDFSLRIYSSKS